MLPDSELVGLEAISAMADTFSTAVDASFPRGGAEISARLQAANATRLSVIVIFEFTVFLSLESDFYAFRITVNRFLYE